MTPELAELGRRALAAGAPEADDGAYFRGGWSDCLLYAHVLIDGQWRDVPDLTHWCWTGWVLEEVRRRGYAYRLCAGDSLVLWEVVRDGNKKHGFEDDIPTALVAMLEATK